MLKSKSGKLTKLRQQPGADARKLSAQNDIRLGVRVFFVRVQNLFQDSNFPKYHFLPIRGYAWNKKENKKDKKRLLQM